MNSAANETSTFVPQEVAFRKLTVRGAGKWSRKHVTTEKAFDRLVEKLSTGDFEFECRDSEGSFR